MNSVQKSAGKLAALAVAGMLLTGAAMPAFADTDPQAPPPAAQPKGGQGQRGGLGQNLQAIKDLLKQEQQVRRDLIEKLKSLQQEVQQAKDANNRQALTDARSQFAGIKAVPAGGRMFPGGRGQ